MTDPAEIIEGHLYLGSRQASLNLTLLEKHNIKYIVNATKEVPNAFPTQFQYLKLDLEDETHEKLDAHYENVWKHIGM